MRKIAAIMEYPWFKCVPAIAMLLLGMCIGWWFNRPVPPWMEFVSLQAFYELGSVKINTDGKYIVHRECIPARWKPNSVAAPVWRYETVAESGAILLYGPQPLVPPLVLGEHQYKGVISILNPIDPKGWAVRVLITCPGEVPETVTALATRVQILGD